MVGADPQNFDSLLGAYSLSPSQIIGHTNHPDRGGTLIFQDDRGLGILKWFQPHYIHADMSLASKEIRSATGLQVGNINYVDESCQSLDVPYALIEHIPGVPLEEVLLSGVSASTKADLLEQAGYAIGRMHSTSAGSFGYIGREQFGRYSDYFMAILSSEVNPGFRGDPAWIPYLRRIEQYISRNEQDMNQIRPAVIHGDMSLGHLLCDASGRAITGIIDLEKARYDDPEVDLNRAEFTQDDVPWSEVLDFSSFWEGYKRARPGYTRHNKIAILRDVVAFASELAYRQDPLLPEFLYAIDKELTLDESRGQQIYRL